MRHRVVGKQLSRSSSHRKALRRNLAVSLIEHGAIRTTEAKAKELRRFIEKLITAAKTGTLHARRRVLAAMGDRDMFDDEGELLDKTVVQKLFDEVAPRYAARPGGYTRIVRISDRRIGDAGRQVILQLVEETAVAEKGAEKQPSRRRRRAAKRQAAAEAAEAAAEQAQQPEAEEEGKSEKQDEGEQKAESGKKEDEE